MGPLAQPEVEELRARLLDLRTRSMGRLVLDLAGVSYVDSRGLEILVEVTDQLGQSGQALKICGVSDILHEVLEVTELTPRFEHFADVNTAVRSFL